MKDAPTDEKEIPEEDISEGVDIPEEFQAKANALLDECSNQACLSYIQNLCYEKGDEMRKSEKKGSKVPDSYSSAEMPD